MRFLVIAVLVAIMLTLIFPDWRERLTKLKDLLPEAASGKIKNTVVRIVKCPICGEQHDLVVSHYEKLKSGETILFNCPVKGATFQASLP